MKAVEEAGCWWHGKTTASNSPDSETLVLFTLMGTDLSSASRVFDSSFCRFFNSIVRMKLFMMVFEVVIFWACLLFMYSKRSIKPMGIQFDLGSASASHQVTSGIAIGPA